MSKKLIGRKRPNIWESADLRQEQHDAKRRLILKQAAVLFADRGFHETTIDQIAEALQVSKPTIYYYIDSKEDLLYEVAHTALADLKAALSRDQDEQLSAIDRLARFFTMYGRLILSEFGVCLALVSDRSLNPQSRRRLRSLKKQFEVEVQKILDEGRADGTIRVDDPKMFTVAIFGAFNWAPQWFSNTGPSTPDEVTAAIFAVFRKAMR
ncbi:TetR/AcrR family transcriptional regulator [Bradyrhizobium neotropicale]|uniref:TetR/AcrR family transcriptional regulator n=1 Tax=Bradyrhizobium neotropicale TaxID=1497615 RepID=UPI001AD7E1FA|nr:TetR/AcrR family transcriptional regulator [Bradyrhizobium neotropicale]MBO4221775.1 TetR family transcriptional regulator [Bradyrhizobium neotropicale]